MFFRGLVIFFVCFVVLAVIYFVAPATFTQNYAENEELSSEETGKIVRTGIRKSCEQAPPSKSLPAPFDAWFAYECGEFGRQIVYQSAKYGNYFVRGSSSSQVNFRPDGAGFAAIMAARPGSSAVVPVIMFTGYKASRLEGSDRESYLVNFRKFFADVAVESDDLFYELRMMVEDQQVETILVLQVRNEKILRGTSVFFQGKQKLNKYASGWEADEDFYMVIDEAELAKRQAEDAS